MKPRAEDQLTSLSSDVLFDMDGTLLDWGDPDEHWREVFEKVASEADGLSPERLFEAVAAQREWFYSSSLVVPCKPWP